MEVQKGQKGQKTSGQKGDRPTGPNLEKEEKCEKAGKLKIIKKEKIDVPTKTRLSRRDHRRVAREKVKEPKIIKI